MCNLFSHLLSQRLSPHPYTHPSFCSLILTFGSGSLFVFWGTLAYWGVQVGSVVALFWEFFSQWWVPGSPHGRRQTSLVLMGGSSSRPCWAHCRLIVGSMMVPASQRWSVAGAFAISLPQITGLQCLRGLRHGFAVSPGSPPHPITGLPCLRFFDQLLPQETDSLDISAL